MREHALNWLVALLLLLGQTALLAHQADFHAHQDRGDDCVICHLGHGLDAFATPHIPLPADVPATLAHSSAAESVSHCIKSFGSPIRAPPTARPG